ncbi:MAG: hypothetical protein ACOX7F_02490 [Eubacteriales bacterium]
MKKHLIAFYLCIICFIFLAACGNSQGATSPSTHTSDTQSTSPSAKVQTPPPTPDPAPDLIGTWVQVDKSEESWQEAVITEDTIEINWVMESGKTTAVYWAGTFVAPTTSDEPYSWDSINDMEKTQSAILASTDESKTFTYADGKISYSVSAMGMTTTVELEKQ